MQRLFSLIVLATMAHSGFAVADRVSSDAEACAVLLRAAPALTQRGDASGDYFCEPYSASRLYYVLALRSRHPEPPGASADWVGSSLVGWFAVRRNDGAILEWDFAKSP